MTLAGIEPEGRSQNQQKGLAALDRDIAVDDAAATWQKAPKSRALAAAVVAYAERKGIDEARFRRSIAALEMKLYDVLARNADVSVLPDTDGSKRSKASGLLETIKTTRKPPRVPDGLEMQTTSWNATEAWKFTTQF